MNTKALMKKAQQRLYFLRFLRKNNLQERMLLTFYRCTIETVLSYGISLWFASCTAAERKALQRVIKTAQKVIGCPLLSPEAVSIVDILKREKRTSNYFLCRFYDPLERFPVSCSATGKPQRDAEA